MEQRVGRYCVVIPAFNAARTIQTVIDGVRGHGLPVVVVDDGSTDETAALAARHGATVISHLRNEGKGSALRSGFGYAMRAAYDGVITMDSDGQHDPGDVAQLIREAERQHARIVVGNRMSDAPRMPALRRWTNRLMSGVVSALTHQRIPDSQCGLRLIRREVLLSVALRATRFEIETELLLAASRGRWKTISVPVRTIYDGHASHIHPLRETWHFLHAIARHCGQRIFSRGTQE